MVSSPVKKRFPTYGHLKEAGLLTEDEMQAILSAQSKSEFLNHVYWVPLSWASTLTVKAFEQVSTIDLVFLYSLHLKTKRVAPRTLGYSMMFQLALHRGTQAVCI